ncbi:TRAP transporter large permease [Rhodospira trueperi]|uniref:TRAP transporter large permease protein n=1 Tax=Rhodospira trueperi TaxID=69960 RepID=A0A1G7EH92_9PROT|nr:TRAP transporter large permease subunit [Rhodospira trueperi]SDE63059.1 TRAP transporter, DctM subunit [Rhodospira trueperi]
MFEYEIIVICLLLTFMGLIFTGFPLAWVLGGVSFMYLTVSLVLLNVFNIDTYFLDDWNDFAIIVDRIWAQMQNWVLVALPMFIFMGLMLDRSGVADKLMANFTKLFRGLRGGLALTVIVIGVLLAASTGIVGASVVLLSMLALPPMMEARYSKTLAAGVVASSGTLGILIPPSIMLVIMADQLSLPVGDLFMGAVFPGLILGVLYVSYVVIAAMVRPDMAPAPERAEEVTWWDVLGVVWSIVPPLLLILAVLGSIFAGIATPTEASGIGALGATVLAAANRRLNLEVLRRVCRETMLTTSFIFGIFLGATAFALVMRSLGGDEFIGGLLEGLPFPPWGVVAFILFIAFVAGFFLDWLEISLIILPLVAPVVEGLGFDLVWFTVLFATTLQTSFLTPPVGFSLFYLKGVAPPGITIGHIYKGVVPFVLLQITGIILVFEFEDLVLWLPEQMY